MPAFSASMTTQELQQIVEKVSLKYFGCKFKHQVKINRRMTTTGGRYYLNDHHIEINAHYLLSQYRKELVGIIKHELVHYHLHLNHKGYRHRDNDFKVLLKKVKGTRYAPDIGLRQKRSARYLYTCQDCGQKFWRCRLVNLHRYGCGKCGGRLKLIKKL